MKLNKLINWLSELSRRISSQVTINNGFDKIYREEYGCRMLRNELLAMAFLKFEDSPVKVKKVKGDNVMGMNRRMSNKVKERIRNLFAKGLTKTQLAERFGISLPHINYILKEKVRKDVSKI